MQTFIFMSSGRRDREVEIAASTHAEARRQCMIKLYGRQPDKVIPHAPLYEGRGLILVRVQ